MLSMMVVRQPEWGSALPPSDMGSADAAMAPPSARRLLPNATDLAARLAHAPAAAPPAAMAPAADAKRGQQPGASAPSGGATSSLETVLDIKEISDDKPEVELANSKFDENLEAPSFSMGKSFCWELSSTALGTRLRPAGSSMLLNRGGLSGFGGLSGSFNDSNLDGSLIPLPPPPIFSSPPQPTNAAAVPSATAAAAAPSELAANDAPVAQAAFTAATAGFESIDQTLATYISGRRAPSSKPKPFGCGLCPSRFTARFNLNKHVRTVHENLRPFLCAVCGTAFQQKCHLKQHNTTVHEHKRPYECTVCGQSFGWPAVLNKHIRLKHDKQRPFPCTLCARTFQQKMHLEHHVLAEHEKLKPYKCEHCDKSFNRKERLKKHITSTHPPPTAAEP